MRDPRCWELINMSEVVDVAGCCRGSRDRRGGGVFTMERRRILGDGGALKTGSNLETGDDKAKYRP